MSTEHPAPTRRSFLQITVAGAGAAVPLAAGADGAAAKVKTLAIRLDKLPKLKKVGGWTVAKIRKWELLFVRSSKTEVKVFNAHCTHRRCLVHYNAAKKRLDCGCHGSKFSLSGKVLSGPARKNLPAYPSWLKGDRVIFKVRV